MPIPMFQIDAFTDRQFPQVQARSIIVTALLSRPECDITSRFFAPCAGIDEDPVTSSAQCCLGA